MTRPSDGGNASSQPLSANNRLQSNGTSATLTRSAALARAPARSRPQGDQSG